MDIKKLAPWNWFKNEEEKPGKPIPVQHGQTREQGYPVVSPMYQLHQEIDRIFDHAFRGFGFSPLGGDRWFAPRLTDGILKPTLDISDFRDNAIITFYYTTLRGIFSIYFNI